jgi:hypothetical protein
MEVIKKQVAEVERKMREEYEEKRRVEEEEINTKTYKRKLKEDNKKKKS